MSVVALFESPDGPGRSLRKLRCLAGVQIADAARRSGMNAPSLHRAEDGDERMLTIVECSILSAIYAEALKKGGNR